MIILPNLKGAIDKKKQLLQLFKILSVGNFTSYNGNTINRIVSLNSDSTIDSNFNVGTGFNGAVNSIAIQSDGKILAAGIFTSYNDTSRVRIARLNTDGTLDSSFTTGTGFSSTVNAIAVQSDGKIVCGGAFANYNGTRYPRITRINTDGTLDSSFNIGTGLGAGFNNVVNAVTVQSDDKIVCGGNFTVYSSTTNIRIARLNTDGTIDSSFSTGSGFNLAMNAVTVQSDGKILCGGSFTSYNGTGVSRIARLNTNGIIDSSFTIGTGFNSTVIAIAVQSDGKILCGGSFTSYNGTTRNYIARLNTDGTLDSSFTTGTGFNSTVSAIAIQADGKIVCGGGFTTYNGTSSNYIARLNTDGILDTSFNIGTGFNSTVNALAIK